MRRLLTRVILLAALLLLLAPAVASAAAGKAEPIVIVADSRSFSGLRAWLSNLYNESLWYFMLAAVFIIPTLGIVLGKFTGFLLARLGINLKSRVLAEH